ncbi:hypothetical protein DL771_008768 [Monosporascus sp. 5C6A]|nr:hypothetical protein DL771_008768 [Monosporascus sp. 5C6A]
MNFTVEVPEGTTHHGDPQLICKPPNWKDYVAFYALNYLIHAATIPSVPGETKGEIVFAVLNALFIPGFGVLRALRRLMLRPGFRRTKPLECANAAGALCMVVSDQGFGVQSARAPRGWTRHTFDGSLDKLWVSPRRKAVAGGITIYRARGDQISRYGYGAFGLSVVPYVFMSLVNIIASLFSPEFPTMYLVHTPDMERAKDQGGRFEGLVGRLVLPNTPDDKVHIDWGAHQGLWVALGNCLNGHDAVMQRLLESGTDVNAKDTDGETPLHWASKKGLDTVQRLLESGAKNGDEL